MVRVRVVLVMSPRHDDGDSSIIVSMTTVRVIMDILTLAISEVILLLLEVGHVSIVRPHSTRYTFLRRSAGTLSAPSGSLLDLLLITTSVQLSQSRFMLFATNLLLSHTDLLGLDAGTKVLLAL